MNRIVQSKAPADSRFFREMSARATSDEQWRLMIDEPTHESFTAQPKAPACDGKRRIIEEAGAFGWAVNESRSNSCVGSDD